MNKSINIEGVHIHSRFFLAPMAGYTDYVFRSLCREFGAGLLVTELVSVAALSRKISRTYRYMKYLETETPLSLQLFGNNEDEYKKAIDSTDLSFYSFIDINMGCPTKKVVRSGGGSAILTDTNKMVSILRAVKSVSKCPVSVKIRLGFRRGEGGTIERVLALKEERPAFITLHGRYASDMYRGFADWEAIAEAKSMVGDFILIGNGDIKSYSDAKKAFEMSKVDGIMVGRGAVGCPWIFDELCRVFDTNDEPKKYSIKDIITRHLEGCTNLYGEVSGIHFMRKFIMKYLSHAGLTRVQKIEFMQTESVKGITDLLEKHNVS